MEAWQKAAPSIKKMTKSGQANYFKKFPDRLDWFKQNHPDMAHFDTSVKKSAMQRADAVKAKAREKLSNLAYGATRGKATGGEGGNADAAPRDTIVPLSRDQHSKVSSAVAAAKPVKEKKPKVVKAEPKPAEKKPLTTAERIAAIARAAKKAQSAAGKAKVAAKFDVATIDPDDMSADDYVDQHFSMHKSKIEEEVEQIKEDSNMSRERIVENLQKLMNEVVRVYDKHGNPVGQYKDKETAELLKPTSKGYKHSDFEGIPVYKKAMKKEAEKIDEVLSKSDKASAWISDFVKSDNPKFKGKSKKERINMALGAYYAAQRNEEVEQIDEVNKHSMLGKIMRGRELKNKVDKSFNVLGDAQRRGDRAGASKAFRNHERYANLERPGTWTKNEEVEQIDEESAHSIVNSLKADGKHRQAGAAAFKHGLGRKYGQHFGLRSTKDKDERAFHAGYDEAKSKNEYAKAERDEAGKQDTYSKKYPGGNKQKQADKDAFMKRFAKEEVEQVDEVNSRHSNVALQQALTPTAGAVKAAAGNTARDKAKTKKLARRVSKITGGEYSKQDVIDNLKSLAEVKGRTPTTPKEKELAAHHGDPNKITFGDVVKARIKSGKKSKD